MLYRPASRWPFFVGVQSRLARMPHHRKFDVAAYLIFKFLSD
jgi:hypothetical protein